MGEIRFSKTASATSKSVSRYSTAFLNTLLVSEDKKSEPANLSPSFELIQSLVDEKCENGEPIVPQLEHLFKSILHTYSRLKELGFTYFDGTVSIIETEGDSHD